MTHFYLPNYKIVFCKIGNVREVKYRARWSSCYAYQTPDAEISRRYRETQPYPDHTPALPNFQPLGSLVLATCFTAVSMAYTAFNVPGVHMVGPRLTSTPGKENKQGTYCCAVTASTDGSSNALGPLDPSNLSSLQSS